MKRYQVISASLKELEGQTRFPSNILVELKPIVNLTFTKQELLRALAGRIGDQNQETIRAIVASADRFKLRRLRGTLVSRWSNVVGSSRFVLPLGSYLCLRPLLFTILFRVRYFFLCYLKSAVREAPNSNTEGFFHNRKQMSSFLTGHRERTEAFAIVLRCIRNIDLRSARTLCVGPRNEAEILLLKQYGFGNVIAIDLFSYSPLIKVMDMNDLVFPDDYFDIYYSSFVLSYSPDIAKTLREAVRVTRSGGVHVFGFTTTVGEDSYGLTPAGSDLKSLSELEMMLRDNIDHVYWRDSWQVADQLVFTIIFRVKK